MSKLPAARGLRCLGVLLLVTCSPAPSKPTVTPLPTIYWKVEQVGAHVQDPSSSAQNMAFLQLFDDGRIASLIETPPSRQVKAMVRSADGHWKEIAVPAAEAGLEITWYDDDANYGGRYLNAPSHGFAMVNGAPHRFSGPPASIRGKLPDGSLALDTNIDAYIYLQKWTLGPTDVDVIDIHNYTFEDQSKARFVTRLAKNGNVYLSSVDTATEFALDPIVVNDTHYVYNPSDMADFGLVTMDRTRGTLFGLKAGIPTVRSPSGDESVGIGGWPVALNGAGDLLYIAYGDTGQEFNVLNPRFRWKGTTYQFSAEAWLAPSGATVVTYGLPQVFDLNEAGQILFTGRAPTGAAEWGRGLYLATPSTTPVPVARSVDVQWATKSGASAPPEAMVSEWAPAASGSFSSSSLTLSGMVPSTDPRKQRGITVLLTSATSAFVAGQPISVVGGVGAIGSVSYVDGSTNHSIVATGGALYVTDLTEFGGFTVRLENVAFKETSDGSVFLANGTVVAR